MSAEDEAKPEMGEEKKSYVPQGFGDDQQNKGAVDHPAIAFVFAPDRDVFPAKPYHEDGNPDYYSKESMDQREALKEDPIIKDAIEQFIQKEFKIFNDEQILSKEQYISQFLKIALILRPGSDPDEIQQIVKEDYENDNGQKQEPTINKQALMDSLYELADIWCPNIDANEYKAFFEVLSFRFRYAYQKDTSAYEVV